MWWNVQKQWKGEELFRKNESVVRNFVERTKVWENIQENDQENTETEIMERYDDVRCSDDRYDYDVCGIEWGNNVFLCQLVFAKHNSKHTVLDKLRLSWPL